MILIFDDQSCLLQIAFTNLFDPSDSIFNEKGYLFDNLAFDVLLANRLIFWGNCRE